MLSMKGGIIPELIEKATEKTVIFTSSSQINKINEEHQEQQQQSEILISSSSWIDLQSLQNNNNEAINISTIASSSTSEHGESKKFTKCLFFYGNTPLIASKAKIYFCHLRLKSCNNP